MLVGLAAYAGGQIGGLQGLLYYGAAYTFMNLGAFGVVAALQRRPGVTSQLDTFAGLGRREPVLGILMTLFMLSLTGIPPTAGFFAKFSVILPAVQAGGWLTVLAVIAVLNARRRVLLPAGRGLHVHARIVDRERASAALLARLDGPVGDDGAHDRPGPVPGPPPGDRDGRGLGASA